MGLMMENAKSLLLLLSFVFCGKLTFFPLYLHLGAWLFCPSLHLKTVGGDICVTATVIELPLAGATGIVALAGLATIYLSPIDM